MSRRAERRAEQQRQLEERIANALPPLDIGQFDKPLQGRRSDSASVEGVLACGEYIVNGATLKDACMLAGIKHEATRQSLRSYRALERGEPTYEKNTEWTLAIGMTLDRAFALRRFRWQMVAEGGGQGSSTALWMLERRGGAEFRQPVQRHEVKRESKEVVVHASIDDALEHTAHQLGLDSDQMRAQGEYWARAMTASQRGTALPSPQESIIELDERDRD
jgi:hypothetical protein